MILETYTIFHTLISLLGILSGFVVLFGLLVGRRLDGWTKFFLTTTVLTSVTGFGFPFHGFTPAIGLGIISLIVLAIAIYARYPNKMAGAWRWIYVVAAVAAFYFNFFVGVVMTFRRVPALHAIAPQQTEAPFVDTQLAVLALFVVFGIIALIKFHPERAIDSPGT